MQRQNRQSSRSHIIRFVSDGQSLPVNLRQRKGDMEFICCGDDRWRRELLRLGQGRKRHAEYDGDRENDDAHEKTPRRARDHEGVLVHDA